MYMIHVFKVNVALITRKLWNRKTTLELYRSAFDVVSKQVFKPLNNCHGLVSLHCTNTVSHVLWTI